MRAHAAAAVEASGRLVNLRSAAPLLLRPTPQGLYLVGGAAGPLGGDELELDLDVGPAAVLTLRSSAASIALPGLPADQHSSLTVRARVGPSGTLRWLPEPSVAAAKARHRVRAEIELAAGAELVWREEVVLGREGESPGTWESDLIVDLDGAPLLRHGLRLGGAHPGWDGPAVVGGAKAIGSLLVVPGADPPAVPGEGAAVLALARAGYLVTAVAADALHLRGLLERAQTSDSNRPCAGAPGGRSGECHARAPGGRPLRPGPASVRIEGAPASPSAQDHERRGS